MTPLERLLARIRRARRWPIPGEDRVRTQLRLWAALRESDEAYIRALMKWPRDRPLIIDNLPEKIVTAYGDLLFGQPPTWTPADEGDADRMTQMTTPWTGELPAAEETCASEGEVWGRLALASPLPHPIVTWHSRLDVVPELHGRAVLAAAFVSRLPGSTRERVWRHMEVHGDGEIVNLLFLGRDNALGVERTLDAHPETAGLVDRWATGIDGLLCWRIPNAWGRTAHVGRSIYHGIWTQFLALNEATTVARENMRLTGKKRAVVPASALRPRRTVDGPEGPVHAGGDLGDGSFERLPGRAPQFDAGEDLLVHDPLDVDEGGSGAAAPFRVLEYSFDAEAMKTYKQDLVETICMRCDLVPQFIGSGDFGQGNTGTALRVRLLPTTNAADSRGRPWDEVMPDVASRGALLERLPIPFGTIGREEWVNAAGPHDFERAEPLPVDENETASRHATLKTSSLISIETSLRERYPDRADEWYTDEVERIRADDAATVPSTFGPPPPSGD